ncbi:RING-H2 finger protein ATL16-like [Diospyros lotus]|uniref:RING-H2 finger protein ATL16-like n=1 Tax=Diospyros lotus TaxID=55363 RepID=UPI0022547BD9|nr:RING-H2 finger protein ATL16-like [Diospyros lotus]
MGTQPLSQIKNQPPPPPPADNGFPILAIAVLCIMATAFLLVSYYIFLTKCCLNWQQLDPLRRFSISRARRNEDPLTAYSPSLQSHGLDEMLIREIPTFQFGKAEETSLNKCVVCLNEFQELDMLRVLPSCGHAFHLDCIDIWLQTNANCPLCRTSISGKTRNPIDRIVAPTSSPQDPQPFTDSQMGGDEDFVVIELGGAARQPERRSESPRKFERKPRKFHRVSITGDEWIDVREKDEQFTVQPIRRSFSMDSASDRLVYMAVQEAIRQNGGVSNGEESSSSRGRRSFFPFGHGRGSRNAVLPIEF